MNVTLDDVLGSETLRAAFVARGVELVDSEVARKGGLSGMALRAGYAAVKGLQPGLVGKALDALLPHFLPRVRSHVETARASGDLPRYFTQHANEIAEALLSVTDEKVARSPNPVIARTYAALRGQAKTHTAEAVPAVGRLLDSFLA